MLDVGCGRGAVLFPAARATRPTGQVLGTDLAPGMVELTRQDVAKADMRHVSVRLGDAQAPELPAASFDVVLAGLVVVLLPDPPGALSAYARLLRPKADSGSAPWAPRTWPSPRIWSHGGRALLRHIPQERLPAATADAAAALRQAQTSDGGIVLTTTARITIAETATGPYLPRPA
ncbi:class I SAM-dependent methyltransferase [Micromonospora sp. AMSO31t]|uniref:class I SAM-dependent methyltransferase n=1 Tax=Micromonospora sp. AMSO31t TaxID=2650566 RepID=UPI00351AF517